MIIDAHEHLPPETSRLAYDVDAVTLFENYPRFELYTAGMTDAQYATMIDRDIPVDERRSVLRGFLPLIRQTSSARTTYFSVRELYGFDDINDSNYLELTEAMKAANKPGIYRWVFRDYCRAAAALNQCFFRIHPAPDSFLRPQVWEHDLNVGCAPHHHLHPFELIEREPETLGLDASRLQTNIGRLAPTVPVQGSPGYKAAVSNYSVSTSGR